MQPTTRMFRIFLMEVILILSPLLMAIALSEETDFLNSAENEVLVDSNELVVDPLLDAMKIPKVSTNIFPKSSKTKLDFQSHNSPIKTYITLVLVKPNINNDSITKRYLQLIEHLNKELLSSKLNGGISGFESKVLPLKSSTSLEKWLSNVIGEDSLTLKNPVIEESAKMPDFEGVPMVLAYTPAKSIFPNVLSDDSLAVKNSAAGKSEKMLELEGVPTALTYKPANKQWRESIFPNVLGDDSLTVKNPATGKSEKMPELEGVPTVLTYKPTNKQWRESIFPNVLSDDSLTVKNSATGKSEKMPELEGVSTELTYKPANKQWRESIERKDFATEDQIEKRPIVKGEDTEDMSVRVTERETGEFVVTPNADDLTEVYPFKVPMTENISATGSVKPMENTFGFYEATPASKGFSNDKGTTTTNTNRPDFSGKDLYKETPKDDLSSFFNQPIVRFLLRDEFNHLSSKDDVASEVDFRQKPDYSLSLTKALSTSKNDSPWHTVFSKSTVGKQVKKEQKKRPRSGALPSGRDRSVVDPSIQFPKTKASPHTFKMRIYFPMPKEQDKTPTLQAMPFESKVRSEKNIDAPGRNEKTKPFQMNPIPIDANYYQKHNGYYRKPGLNYENRYGNMPTQTHHHHNLRNYHQSQAMRPVFRSHDAEDRFVALPEPGFNAAAIWNPEFYRENNIPDAWYADNVYVNAIRDNV